MPDRRVVALDVDDTLYLERDYVRSGFAAAGVWLEARRGVPGASEVFWNRFEGGERETIFNRGLEDIGLEPSPELVQALVDVYRSHVPDIALLEDARAALDELVDLVDLAVITDGPVASQRAKVAALELERWVSLVVVTGEHGSGFGKPSPEPYRMVEKHFAVESHQCAYVADNPAKDFVAPYQRGWRTVRVRRAGGLHHALTCQPPTDFEVPDLVELVALLELASDQA